MKTILIVADSKENERPDLVEQAMMSLARTMSQAGHRIVMRADPVWMRVILRAYTSLAPEGTDLPVYYVAQGDQRPYASILEAGCAILDDVHPSDLLVQARRESGVYHQILTDFDVDMVVLLGSLSGAPKAVDVLDLVEQVRPGINVCLIARTGGDARDLFSHTTGHMSDDLRMSLQNSRAFETIAHQLREAVDGTAS